MCEDVFFFVSCSLCLAENKEEEMLTDQSGRKI